MTVSTAPGPLGLGIPQLTKDQRSALAVAGGDGAGPVRRSTLPLPFLTVLAPSARWSEVQGKRHKAPTDWAEQAILQTHAGCREIAAL